MQTTASAAIRQPRLTAPTDARDKRDPIGLTPRVTVDLYRLQKTLFRDAGDAPIGQQIEVLALRFDQGQPHLDAALDARHLDGGLKARTGRRRPGYLQHRILDFPKRRRNATYSGCRPTFIMSDSRHNWNWAASPEGGSIRIPEACRSI
jgi:hypothetical protein